MDKTPMQRSAHELCHECVEYLPLGELVDFTKVPGTRLLQLAESIAGFEKSHASLLEIIPFAECRDEPHASHPGSLSSSDSLKSWEARYGRRKRE
jgi:hypothetical protein